MNMGMMLVMLRSAALALTLGGRKDIGEAVFGVADGVERSAVTDEALERVADLLKNRSATKEDWQDVLAQLDEDYRILMASPARDEPPPIPTTPNAAIPEGQRQVMDGDKATGELV